MLRLRAAASSFFRWQWCYHLAVPTSPKAARGRRFGGSATPAKKRLAASPSRFAGADGARTTPARQNRARWGPRSLRASPSAPSTDGHKPGRRRELRRNGEERSVTELVVITGM